MGSGSRKGSDDIQKRITNVTTETETNIGDIGITGDHAVSLFESATGFAESTTKMLSNTAAEQARTVREISADQTRAAETIASGQRATADQIRASRDSSFGGFDITTTALIFGAVAATVTIVRSMPQ